MKQLKSWVSADSATLNESDIASMLVPLCNISLKAVLKVGRAAVLVSGLQHFFARYFSSDPVGGLSMCFSRKAMVC